VSTVEELPGALRPPAHRSLRWPRWSAPTGALAAGLVLGVVVGAAAVDPTRTPEYQRLQSELAAAQAAPAAVSVSVGEGLWTVGRDLPAGTYRTARPVAAGCYWALTATGSQGTQVLDDDAPAGGSPTVQLGEGQDFENDGCGLFVRVG
jgi:hypothetical protein